MKNINETLRHQRIVHGLTQQDLADHLSIHRTTYTKYEKDHTPEIGILIKIADFYSITVDELLGLPKAKAVSTTVVFHSPEKDKEDAPCTWDEIGPITKNEKRLLSLYRVCKDKSAALDALRRIALELDSPDEYDDIF
ncbi:MAG: helix-turn-helix domain-containing protein [Clostridia bacterium]|nr:helix-turn-helix domain-containing protein [Clostridia bacterium]